MFLKVKRPREGVLHIESFNRTVEVTEESLRQVAEELVSKGVRKPDRESLLLMAFHQPIAFNGSVISARPSDTR